MISTIASAQTQGSADGNDVIPLLIDTHAESTSDCPSAPGIGESTTRDEKVTAPSSISLRSEGLEYDPEAGIRILPAAVSGSYSMCPLLSNPVMDVGCLDLRSLCHVNKVKPNMVQINSEEVSTPPMIDRSGDSQDYFCRFCQDDGPISQIKCERGVEIGNGTDHRLVDKTRKIYCSKHGRDVDSMHEAKLDWVDRSQETIEELSTKDVQQETLDLDWW